MLRRSAVTVLEMFEITFNFTRIYSAWVDGLAQAVATGFGMDCPGSGVRVPGEVRMSCLEASVLVLLIGQMYEMCRREDLSCMM
jgi:hypothetical protein